MIDQNIYDKFVEKLRSELPMFPKPNAYGTYPYKEACDALDIRSSRYVWRNLPENALINNCLTPQGVLALARHSTSSKKVNLAARACLSVMVEEAFPSRHSHDDSKVEELCDALQNVLDSFRTRKRKDEAIGNAFFVI